jgi:hypothetical protein
MAAGLGFKTFVTGDVLTATDVNGYLMQGVLVFASAAARDAAITAPAEGQFAFTKDTNGLWFYDGAAWVASGATGDIEGVTAGVGISGGGTSGTVTVTNSMATAITTSGDLIQGTGSGTFARLGSGTAGQFLTTNGTTLSWGSGAVAGPAFQAYLGGSNQSITASTWTKVQLNTEEYDTNNDFDSTTNYRFTPDTAGKYLLGYAMNTNAGAVAFAVYKNGSLYKYFPMGAGSVTASMNGTTDYIEWYVYLTGASIVLYAGSDSNTAFGTYLRS